MGQTKRKIYRIERRDSMNGMWYTAEGKFKPTIQDLCPNSRAKDFPMGYSKDHKTNGKNWYSAGKNKKDMHYWFSKEDATNLINNDFKVMCYLVEEWIEKEHEILFTRESIVFEEEINLEEIWK